MRAYLYDCSRYYKYGDCFTRAMKDNEGEIIKNYHIVEKGLTMPETRLGFGRQVVLKLADCVSKYIKDCNATNDQVLHAVKVLLEYQHFHQERDFVLDDTVVSTIASVAAQVDDLEPSKQCVFTGDTYLSHCSSPFDEFAQSRYSIRNFSSTPVAQERILAALDLAKTAPSACNRQCWRTYVYTSKEQIQAILDIQGGSRGFGHLADKLIVVTGKLSLFADVHERNQAFIDGGIYAMNLLYSLHFNRIGACILNCSNWPEKDKIMRKAASICDGEVFIAMVACGEPLPDFTVACSPRKPIAVTNTVV